MFEAPFFASLLASLRRCRRRFERLGFWEFAPESSPWPRLPSWPAPAGIVSGGAPLPPLCREAPSGPSFRYSGLSSMSSFCPSWPSAGRTRFFLTVPSLVAKRRRPRPNDGSGLPLEGGLASIAHRDPGKADSGAQGFRHRNPQGVPEYESGSPLAIGGSL